ncbi:MAG TPA: type IV toxin-antitoxin system AbiEi family antitoxin domain-containing protein [Chlamydiales bacterium]|nr:type IV toxin-antitoxin system AbiEi family antitoxin domain-containing protein [Chlamydiales bacterium]
MKNSISGLNLLRYLAEQGLKIFSIKQAQAAASEVGMNPAYVSESLHNLTKGGWVARLKRGVYVITAYGPSPHEFAVAMALVTPSAISHWTAMHYHHVTEQTPNKIFASTPRGTSIPRSLSKTIFHFIQVKKEHYFGIETIWVDDMKAQITNLEKTLLDGLTSPEYCGDFNEVLHAFKISKDRIRIQVIVEYALKLGKAVAKRLGFILENLRIEKKHLDPLLKLPMTSYCKLDPSSPVRGSYNSKWKIRKNI